MPYDVSVNRGDVQALIPEEVSDVMMTNIESDSAALALFQHVPISSNQVRMPVLSALPVAYFVNGDTGRKQTTKMAWENRYFNVEEIAAIVPAPEAVIDDVDFDFWAGIQPSLEDAISRALDAAIFFGVNKPSSWPDSVLDTAIAAGNIVTEGTATAQEGGLATDISELLALLEGAGYDATAAIARTTLRARVRNLRDTTGQPITQLTPNDWWGVPVTYPMRGLWPTEPGTAEAIVGDFTQGKIGIRRDITYKMLDQAVIQDNTGEIIFNLAQQDMVALRVVARFAYQVANPITWDQVDPGLRYPFAALISPSGS